MPTLRLYTDGGARGNPGPAGAGIIIEDGRGKTLDEFGAFLGHATNNQAEYRALVLGFGRVIRLLNEDPVKLAKLKLEVFLDSELLVRQLKGEYRVKNKLLKPLHNRVQKLTQEIGRVTFSHLVRARNTRADRLANQALNRALKN